MIVDGKYKSTFDELKAETVLSVISPDVKHWNVLHKGYFYHNYLPDLISVDTSSKSIETSRNGLMKILPEGLFFSPNELDTKDDVVFKKKKGILDYKKSFYTDLFKPFDSVLFDLSLHVESFINETSDNEISILLNVFAGINYDNITNLYAKALTPLILVSSRIRGNFNLIIKLLSAVTHCAVSYELKKMTVLFIVNKQYLNSAEYKNFTNELNPVFELVENWFIPIQYNVKYMVKDHTQKFILSSEKPLLLNYNTIFKN